MSELSLAEQVYQISKTNYQDIVSIKEHKNTLRLIKPGEKLPALEPENLDNALSELRPEIKRIKTGIDAIDRLFLTFVNSEPKTGIPVKDIILLSGMSGIGKTTLAFTMFSNMYRSKLNVTFFSFDMKSSQTFDAFRNAFSGFKATANDHLDNISIVGKKPLIVCRRSDVNLSLIDEYLIKYPMDCIFIDYFDKLSTSGTFKTDKERYISLMAALKNLTEKHNCAIVLLIQGNEDKGYKYGKPTLMNVYGGKEVRSEVDHILAVYRRSKHDETLPSEYSTVTEVIGLKLRSHASEDVAYVKLDNGMMKDMPWYEKDNYIIAKNNKKK